ncbi:MAG: hypothetical protein ACTTKB_08180 [Treponema sp.]
MPHAMITLLGPKVIAAARFHTLSMLKSFPSWVTAFVPLKYVPLKYVPQRRACY